ncbi:MAG: AMP-binding protein [Sphaerochaetaceae bacterium]|nr:AMP-binding protein [Sphaerochaetaceae bacterium]
MRHELDVFTIRHALERSAKRHDERIAMALIGNEESSVTFAELKKQVDAMATYLIEAGIESQDKVALLGESQPSWGVAYLAVVSAGAVAVPILPDFSAKEISSILAHSGAKAIVVSSKLFEKSVPFSSDASNLVMRMDDLFEIPKPIFPSLVSNREFQSAPGRDMLRTKSDAKRIAQRTSGEDDLVSIIYTSGTTGSSKGVMLTNRNLTSNASACVRQFFKITTGMRFLSILPLSHSYEFTIGFLLPLITGCEIHYLGKTPAASILLPAMKRIRPHVMLSVPLLIEKIYRSSVVPQIAGNPRLSELYKKPLFRRFINSVIGKKLKRTFGGHLKFFGVGGAALDKDVENFLKEAKFPYAIGYGLTETAPLLAGSGPKQTKPTTVGYAVKGIQLRIDDPDPETKVGEIVAKGPNVMQGYYENPSLTAEVFTADGWFKTGDLGIIERNRLSIKGRKKTMILGPSGENIYPELIETLINNRPYVQESLVLSDEGGLAAMIKLDLELMAENLKISVQDAKESAATYLVHLKEEVNKELSSFSRIRDVSLQDEPFQRTPTMKIKRYLYQIRNRGRQEKEVPADKPKEPEGN